MRIRRIILGLTTFVFIFTLFSFFTFADTEKNESKICDYSFELTTLQKNELEEKIASAERNCDADIRVLIYDYSKKPIRYDISKYESEMGERFDDLLLLVISYEYGEYYYELLTKGIPHDKISEREANRILDSKDVYDNIKSGNLYSGIDSFIALSEKAISGTLRNSFKSVIVPAIILSLAVALTASICVVLRYRKKLHSVSYPLNKYARLDLNISNDNFINKTVTRVRVRSESNSSGRSGGSSFGGSRGRR